MRVSALAFSCILSRLLYVKANNDSMQPKPWSETICLMVATDTTKGTAMQKCVDRLKNLSFTDQFIKISGYLCETLGFTFNFNESYAYSGYLTACLVAISLLVFTITFFLFTNEATGVSSTKKRIYIIDFAFILLLVKNAIFLIGINSTTKAASFDLFNHFSYSIRGLFFSTFFLDVLMGIALFLMLIMFSSAYYFRSIPRKVALFLKILGLWGVASIVGYGFSIFLNGVALSTFANVAVPLFILSIAGIFTLQFIDSCTLKTPEELELELAAAKSRNTGHNNRDLIYINANKSKRFTPMNDTARNLMQGSFTDSRFGSQGIEYYLGSNPGLNFGTPN